MGPLACPQPAASYCTYFNSLGAFALSLRPKMELHLPRLSLSLFFLRERVGESRAGQREREGERILSRFHAQHRAQHRA